MKVRVVVPFNGIVAAPKALVMLGGFMTVKFADAVLPVPPFVEVIAFVVFRKLPSVIPVTLTLNEQDVLTARVAPLRDIVLEPAGAVIVPLPQEPDRPLGVLT